MDKQEAKELTKAVQSLAKSIDDATKTNEKKVRYLSEISDSLKELKGKYSTLSMNLERISETINSKS